MHAKKHLILLRGVLLLFCLLAISGIFASRAFAAPVAKASVSRSLSCPPEQVEGDQGTWVVVLQEHLNSAIPSLGVPNAPMNFHPISRSEPLDPDGSFGPNTFAAVWDFQTWWNNHIYPIDVDGRAGPQTWHALGVC